MSVIHNGDELEVSNGNECDLSDVFCSANTKGASAEASGGTVWFSPAARCVHAAEAGLLLAALCWVAAGAVGGGWAVCPDLMCSSGVTGPWDSYGSCSVKQVRGCGSAPSPLVWVRASCPARLGWLLDHLLPFAERNLSRYRFSVLRAVVHTSSNGATSASSRTLEGWFHFKLCHCYFLPMH